MRDSDGQVIPLVNVPATWIRITGDSAMDEGKKQKNKTKGR
jgi:hypothetical protein